MADADYSITQANATNSNITATGANTAIRNFIFPASMGGFWNFFNNTTGGFTVTVKTSGGTGVTVRENERMLIASDGTNCYSAELGVMRRDGLINWAVAAGTADALTAAYTPTNLALVDGQLFFVRATAANATTTPTLAIDSLTAEVITKNGGIALAVGDINNLQDCIFRYNLANTRFELMNPKSGFTGGTVTSTLTMSGAAINEAFATIASAGTTNIGAAAANYLQVTGTTTINAFDTIQAGTRRTLEFAGILTLTNGTAIILPGSANIPTAAGDIAIFESEGSGNWRCVSYTTASGKVLAAALASAATTLTGTDATQALTAAGFAGNKSLTSNGYYKLPGGLIIQWYEASLLGSGTNAPNYPVAFPTNVFAVVATGWGGSNITGVNIDGSPTLTSATIRNTSASAQTAYVIAIGN